MRIPPAGAPGQGSTQLTGSIAAGPFAFHGIRMASAETEFSWKDGAWFLRGLKIVRPGGQERLTAEIMSKPGEARLKATASLDPALFAPYLPPRGQAAIAEWKFNDPPQVEFTAAGASFADPGSMRFEGKLTLGHTRFRGVGLNRLRSEFTFADHALTYRRLTLEREEGAATADMFVYDFGHHEIRLKDVHTTLDPAQVSVWLDPDVARALAPYRFHKAPTTTINGVVTLDGVRNSHLVVEFNAPAGADYTFAHKVLNFRPLTGEVIFNEDRLRVNNLKGGIFDGHAEGNLDLSLVKGAMDYTANIDLQEVDFTKLTKLYFNYDDSAGKLAGSYRFSGRGDDPRTLRGAGSLKVDQGNVFAIPFLGPLSTAVNTLAPGLGFDIAKEGSLDFLTNAGKIYTGNLRVQGTGFSMFGGGWLGFIDDTMNFRMRINARGLPGAVLYPVSKLLEYGSQGPLSKPVWRPRALKIESEKTGAQETAAPR